MAHPAGLRSDHCLMCRQIVRPLQEALLCEGCQRWQHRTCGSGITRMEYRKAVELRQDIDWVCNQCKENENETVGSPVECAMPIENATDMSIHSMDTENGATPVECVMQIENVTDVSMDTENECKTGAIYVEDLLPTDIHTVLEEIIYEKVLQSSQRGSDKLIDSLGYSYTIKRKTSVAVHWRCVVRNTRVTCEAKTKEMDGIYERGTNQHCHPPEACPLIASKISSTIKKKAMEDVFRSAADIVDEVLCDEV
ncbi:hypothetical protein O3P69_002235, partial [Scylla paramamosain]